MGLVPWVAEPGCVAAASVGVAGLRKERSIAQDTIPQI